MAIRIKFDSTHNAQSPTYVLATRSGRRLGKLPAYNITFKDTLNSYSEIFFRINKVDCVSNATKDEKINMKPISVHNVINTMTGYVKVGSVTVDKYRELVEYASIISHISNFLLQFRGESATYKFTDISLVYSTDDAVVYVVDAEETILLRINSEGSVHIYNPQSIGLIETESCKVDLSFDVPVSVVDNKFWNKVKDFKLMYCREYDMWFELYVEVDESNHLVKNVTAKSLGEAELSQIILYGIEINTELDISRDDYKPTILFDETDPKASLLDRITEKAPHYKITHVDKSIAKIQRTFSFDSVTIYDAFQAIAQEINCLFIIKVCMNNDGNISREIAVYDLESNCLDCGKRDEFTDICPECGSKNILNGYGKDTTIFVSTDNLASDIQYSTNVDSVKNCFRLVAGDDLMTATLVNCNPNGSGYIWYVSDESKEDMSDELVSTLSEYDTQYAYYQKEHVTRVPSDLLNQYNNLIDKYIGYTTDTAMPETITGYPALMNAYYDAIDMYLYLNNELMPDVSMQDTTAVKEAVKLNAANLSPVAVLNLDKVTAASANNAVLSVAKVIVDSRYQVKIKESLFDGTVWSGNFTVTNYSDEEDTATSARVTLTVNDNYETYVKQKIEKSLNGASDESTDVVAIFDLEEEDFIAQIKKYCLSRLESFHDACQACLDILIEQGIADKDTWANEDPDLYRSLYVPYYNKLTYLSEEIKVRESEIAVIIGTYDRYGELITEGVQTVLEKERDTIQEILNFEKFLGEELWLEFVAYRREDMYQNDNYISDGLNNAELFERALEFIEVAKKDIYKSATLQHSITATLKNLLVMKEFAAIVDYFEVGNWIRVKVDGEVYKLRIVDFEIDYDNLDNISIVFSDVKSGADGVSDAESIMNQAASMATSYGAVSRQASQGSKTKQNLDGWVTKGLALTKMKIIDSADNQNITFDSHGLLCKEYLPITDDYDEKQLKLINRGIYLTDDNWLTSRAGIGDFTFYNPETGKMEETYGVIADTLVGNLILSEKVGIYNKKNSITLDQNGVIITSDNTGDALNQTSFTIQKKSLDADGNEYLTQIMYVDSDGNLVLNGTIRINSTSDDSVSTLDDLTDTSRFSQEIKETIDEELYRQPDEDVEGDTGGVYSTINLKYQEVHDYADAMLSEYKASVGQYMQYDENGLTLGSTSSNFKTVIDNERLAFKDGDAVVAYISNSQLYITDAIIRNSLILGNFFFSPREDGGVSLTWQGG